MNGQLNNDFFYCTKRRNETKDMGLIDEEIEIYPTGNNIKLFESKGYIIPKRYDEKTHKWKLHQGIKIKIKSSDLSDGANIEVHCECDICKEIVTIQKNKYTQNVRKNNGNFVCSNSKRHKEIREERIFQNLKELLESFLNKYERFPQYNEYTKENGFPLTYYPLNAICKKHNTSLTEMQNSIDCFKTTIKDITYYDIYINKLKEIIDGDRHILTDLYTFFRTQNTYGLPDIRWFIHNCPDNTVIDLASFKRYLGYYDRHLTKEECIDIIYKMSQEMDRPLMYDDFRPTGYGKVTIPLITQYWGSVNKMKKELNLEVIQESMIDKKPTSEEIKYMLEKIADYANSMGKEMVSEKEINYIANQYNLRKYLCLDKWCQYYYNKKLSEKLLDYGISMGTPGRGNVHTFEDGEITTSQFEFIFSKFLREFGLIYEKDYFRNIRYSSIDKNYNGLMNCDYLIIYKGKSIYIEIAGIIEAYKQWYYKDQKITCSKSKENYRIKLKVKEELLNKNNLIYFILFPCDLTRDIFMSILENPTIELRKNIEKRYKHNINWKVVSKIGELKYQTELGRDGQPKIDYKEAI